MSTEAFADLKQALEDVLAFESGERRELIVTRMERPPLPSAVTPEKVSIKTKQRS